MRYAFVVLLAALGCKSAPSAAPPANKAPMPDRQAMARDELAFLTSDADFIIGIDMVALRGSQLWRSFEPQIDAFMRQAQDLMGGGCGGDFMKRLERLTVAIKVPDENNINGVFVLHGGDMPAALECSAKSAPTTGKVAKFDRGVLLLSQTDKPIASASRAVTPTTMVGHLHRNASHDSLETVLASGVPLRGSAEFMKLYTRREPGAAMWGMANGNAPLFAQLASTGMQPRSIDGTIRVTDVVAVTVRMTMPGPAEASRVASEVDQVKAMAARYVERIETRVTGPMLQIEVVVNEAQLRDLASLMGGMMNATSGKP